MITPEDLERAASLLREGRLSPQSMERLLASAAHSDSSSGLRAMLDRAVEGESAVRPSAAPEATRSLGRYRVLGEIARGGMGVVYRAWEPSLKREVAIKVLLEGERARPELVERFQREARAAAALSHPNIVPIYEVGEDAGVHFFAMELIHGVTLDKLLKREGFLPPRTALRIARDVARALQHAHERGIVHRDVKPGNVMLAEESSVTTRDGLGFRVMLGDFGLAKEAGGASLTVSGSLIGTPAYMSPEQAGERVSEIDARSDVYSLGAVTYELLTGRQPFEGANLGDILAAIEAQDAESLRSVRPGVPRDVDLIVGKALMKEKSRRYQTAGELADDIELFLNGEAVSAVPPTLAYRASRWARRHRAAVAAAAVCLLALIGAAGWLVADRVRVRKERRSRAEFHLANARKQAGDRYFDAALVEVGLAESLVPGMPEAATERAATRVAQCRHEVEALASQGNWEGARGVLSAFADVRDRPEVAALARRVAGTCRLEVRSAEAGLEADLVRADPGIFWDEECFPAMAAAREAGISRRLGAAPAAPMDVEFGDWLVVLSRDGRATRVIPIRLERSAESVIEHRVARVGASADFATLDAAIEAALPGWTIELAAGEHAGPARAFKPGLLVRPARGAAATLRGGGFAGPGNGAAFRDLRLESPARAGVAFSNAFRPSFARCVVIDARVCAIELGGCEDVLVRDVSVERSGESGLQFLGVKRGLAWGVRVAEGGWAGIIAHGEGLTIARCASERSRRAGYFLRGTDVTLLESRAVACLEWAVLAPEGRDIRVRDCVFRNCSSSDSGGTPVVVGFGNVSGPEAVHNTLVGGAGYGVAFSENVNKARFTDNIIVGVAGPAMYWHGGGDSAVFDWNLAWNCGKHGRLWEIECATLEEFREAPLQTGYKSFAVQVHGLAADPMFRDAEAGDLRLRSESPARRAASDGSDRGARFEAIESDALESAAWVLRENGRTYARLGAESLAKGDRAGAEAFAKRARACAPEDARVGELLRALQQK